MRKIIIYSLFLGMFYIAYEQKLEASVNELPKAVVSVEKVKEVKDIESRKYTGLVVSQSRVQIVPRVSGEILEIGFKDGTIVKKGQMLYQLDPIQYKATVKSAEAKVLEYKARLKYAQINYDRQELLFKKNAASRDSMENAESAFEAYKASLLAAEADLIKSKDDLKNTTIVTPLEGIVGVTNFTVGNYVTPSSGDMVTIIQVEPVRVRFSISTADLLSMFSNPEDMMKNGIVNVVLSDGSLYATEGKIELLNNEANNKTDTIQIFATFPNKDHKLIVGSTVSVTLSKRKGQMLPAVLPSAIMHDNQGSFVYIVGEANKVEKRYVVLGSTTSDLQMIISGLKAGEIVIVKGTNKTMPGADIEPVEMGK